MTTGPDALLRRVKQLKQGSTAPSRSIWIGARSLDLSPDRDAETVKKWLTEPCDGRSSA